MVDAPSIILVPGGILSFAYGAVGAGSPGGRLALYSEDDDCNGYKFAELPVNFHVDIRASLHKSFNTIWKMSWLPNVVVPWMYNRSIF